MGRAADDRGFTLVELIVAVTIVALAITAIFGGLGLFLRVENTQRANASLDANLRTYAEKLMNLDYVDCAAGTDYTKKIAAPSGYTATMTFGYWNGDLPASGTTGATFASTCTSDRGLQRITITLTDSNGNSQQLLVGKAR